MEHRKNKRSHERPQGFLAGVRDVFERYAKRTSAPHKRSVLLLILGGALLRGWFLFEPITYEEARAFDLFIGRSVKTIISDYTDPLNHVLHSLLAKGSVSVFGVNKVALRLPAFLAGVLSMPLFYLFTRAMFNRYIAMLVLALVASSGPLIEMGAQAQGYVFTWLSMVLALVLGRHFVKDNNRVSAVLIGVCLALGMYTMPGMMYPAVTIYLYLLFYILLRYEGSIRKRLSLLLLSFAVFLVLTFLLYMPIISHHGIGHVLDHPSLPERSWGSFKREHQEGAFALWVAIADTTGSVIALLGIAAVLVSAFISSKYRLLMFALALGSVPLVILMARVAPPPEWYYTLYLFHLGSGIALFYLLKFIQEKVFTALGKRTRTAVTSAVLFIGLSTMAFFVVRDRVERFPEAASAGAFLGDVLRAEDKAYAEHPWDAPIRFHAREHGIGREYFQGRPAADGWVYVLVAPIEGQAPAEILESARVDLQSLEPLQMVKDWPRIEIFAARYREGSSMQEAN